MSVEHSSNLSPENLSFPPKKDYYLTAGETSVLSEQELTSSTQSVTAENETTGKAPAEIEKNGENFVTEKIDLRTSKLLLKIFARNSQETLTVPDSFKSFLQQYANDPFLRNYLKEDNEDSLNSNSAKCLQPLEPYRARKDYQAYIDDPFFLFLLYNRFYNNLHYDWQQKDEVQSGQQSKLSLKEKLRKTFLSLFSNSKKDNLDDNFSQTGQAQSIEKVLRALGKALFDARDRYESYVNSHIDARTGLLSNSALKDYFAYLQNPNRDDENEKKEPRNEIYGYAIVMIDIDHFKDINDTYGHIIGDHALQKLSQAFRSSTARQKDAFFRYGGDEFTLIMPLSSDNQNKVITDELKEFIFKRILDILHPISQQMQKFPVSKTETKDLTLSAGVYILPASEMQTDQKQDLQENIESIIKKADQTLYKAKEYRNSLSTFIAGREITFPLTA